MDKMEKEFAVAAGILYLQCMTNEYTTKQEKKESCNVFLKAFEKNMKVFIDSDNNADSRK